jgi:hypothetical protein
VLDKAPPEVGPLVLPRRTPRRGRIKHSDLRALEYKGSVPDKSVLPFAGSSPPPTLFCDIEFCNTKVS